MILPGGVAPDLPGVQVPPSDPPPPSLVQALQAQSGLRQLPTEGGVIAFQDAAWTAADSPVANAVVALVTADHGTPAWLREVGVGTGMFVVVLAIAEGVARRRRRRRPGRPGAAPPGDGEPASEPAPSALP